MNVELAEERILVLKDRFTLENAEQRSWAKRTDAFGAFAKIGGMIKQPKDEEFSVVYRERRLQPFWRLSTHTDYTYERKREHRLKCGPEVQSVTLYGATIPATNKEAPIVVTELCREEQRREWLFDGLTKAQSSGLRNYLDFETDVISSEALNDLTRSGTVVVPPQAKASFLTREVLTQSIPKIEADRILEEKIQVDQIDLFYRPVHAFRYRWQGKEAVVEFDAVTGDARAGGSTFETYVGKLIDKEFLLDAGIEAANMFLPGVNLAKIIVVKGLKIGQRV
jgi:hypothetical protein